MIEFALLSIPFFAIIGATLETAVVFMAGQFLDSAVQDASRLIRTGQAQNSAFNTTDFREQVCAGLYGMFNCENLIINVEVINSFASADLAPPVDDEGEWTIEDDYQDGAGNSIVMVRAYYKWPTILNVGGFTLHDQPDGTRLLGAVRVFRNEPFG